ncbi:MAG: PEP-CTERM sorting domain-containing protein [Phycisphaerales bacterium]|nr:PEP-CTERM sorting domain-containing protein [Phycisphaerales bacterium]
MSIKATIGMGAVLAFAGGAQADLMTTGDGQATSLYIFRSADPQVSQSIEDVMTGSSSFDLGYDLDSSVHPTISGWHNQFSGGVSSGANSVVISADSAIQGSLLESAMIGGNRARTRNTIGLDVQIQVTEATMATIAFDGMFGAATNDRTALEVTFNVSSQLGSFADFSAGFNTGTQVDSPFSFDTPLLAGDVIEVQFIFEHYVREGDPAFTSVDEFLSTSLSITTVPAPGAMALLGLGGLFSARRRR